MHAVLSVSEDEQNNNHLIRSALLFINEHAFESDFGVRDVADHVYLTQTYMSSLFKKKTGITIGQYILDLRIQAAKEYLQNPKYKLYQISQMVGYSDSNYFAKLFKKRTGFLPSEYRDQRRPH